MGLIGIVQGRLSSSPKNRLQYFPKFWEKEFTIAKELKYDFIEFFSERKYNPKNPIWTNSGIKKYKQIAKKNNIKILNFCDDYIISNSFFEKKTLLYLKRLSKNIRILGVKNLILPFYGKSFMTDKNYLNFSKSLINLIKINKNINILIESNISPYSFNELKKSVKSSRLKFLFDTGNRINLERDLYQDLKLFKNNIGHIHIKDKNKKKQNVPLNTGLVNFNKVFKVLKKLKYKKNFTFETTRSNNPHKTALKNIKFLKKKFNV